MPDKDYFDRAFEQECIEFLTKHDDGQLKFKHNILEHCILTENLSYEETDYTIMRLKVNKSPGQDKIPGGYVKACKDHIAHHMQCILNYMLDKRVFPGDWALGLCVAIPKGPNDIQPITILSLI